MPLFSWMRWTRGKLQEPRHEEVSQKSPTVKTSVAVAPGGTLMQELLQHVEEHERVSRQYPTIHSDSTPGHQTLYPQIQSLMPTSERRQLELLCAQIHPTQTATILCRFREVLASNTILPWQLVSVFKQVLTDFLEKEGGEGEQREDEETNRHSSLQRPSLRQSIEVWANQCQTKQGFVMLTTPDGGEAQREEIPTISRYVDCATHDPAPGSVHRDRNLPYYYSTIAHSDYCSRL